MRNPHIPEKQNRQLPLVKSKNQKPGQYRQQQRRNRRARPHSKQHADRKQITVKQQNNRQGPKNPRNPSAAPDSNHEKTCQTKTKNLHRHKQQPAEIFREKQSQSADRFLYINDTPTT